MVLMVVVLCCVVLVLVSGWGYVVLCWCWWGGLVESVDEIKKRNKCVDRLNAMHQ